MNYEELEQLLQQVELRVSAGILALREYRANQSRYTPEALKAIDAGLKAQIGLAQILGDQIPNYREEAVEV